MKLTDLTIEITRRCLNKCIFCSSSSGPDETNALSKEQVEKVLRQAVDLGLEEVAISGGEPLLHPDLLGILESCKEFGLKVALYTSGVIEQDNKIVSFLDWASLGKYLNRVVFNVTSVSPYNRDNLYRRNDAVETFESMDAAQSSYFDIEAHIVPNKINLFGLKSLVKYLDSRKVKKVSFLRLVNQGHAFINENLLELSFSEFQALNEILYEISLMDLSIERRFGIPFAYAGLSSKKCIAGISKLVVTPTGHIAPCEALKNRQSGQFLIGHIDVTSLERAINNAKNSESLNKLREEKKTSRDLCIVQ